MIDKRAFFQATQRPTATVDVPGFGQVQITALTIADRLSLSDRFKEDPARTSAWIVCKAVDGLTEDDIDQALEMDGKAISAIGDAVLEISGMGDEEEGAAKND